MKKIVATLVMGVIIAGTAVTSVSAETHEVEKGDNLWNIADQYDTTVDELVEINKLKTTIIQPKQTLFINSQYIVEKSDTLIGIGKEYNVTVENLKKWNGLKSDIIAIGQVLEIKGVNVVQEDAPTAEAAKEQSSKQVSQNTATAETEKQEKKSEDKPSGKTIKVTSTAYTANCSGCSGVTSTGIDLNENPNAKVIAVDPNVIPLGSRVYVEGYGYATAADEGSAINGNKIDVYVPTKDRAYSWGVRTVNVTIVN